MGFNRVYLSICPTFRLMLTASLALLSLTLALSSSDPSDARDYPTKESVSTCNQFTQEIGELIAVRDFTGAKALAMQAVSGVGETVGRSVAMADALRDLAEVYQRLGDTGLAILNYEKSLKLRSQLMGRDHVSCEPVICRLIALHKEKRDDSVTITLLEQLLCIRRKALSGDCAEIMNPMADLSRLQVNAGSAGAAAKTLNSMADIKARQFGSASVAAANYKLLAGITSLNAHDLQQSETHLKQALEIYAKSGGTAESGACYYFLGRVYDELGLPQKSASSYHSCLSAHKEFGDSNQFTYQEALRRAGPAFVKNGEFSDGLQILNQVIPLYEQKYGKNARCLEPLLLALAECYEHSDRPEMTLVCRNRAARLDPRPSKPRS
jgi:tetratricopeptide (TPR) repeat protein